MEKQFLCTDTAPVVQTRQGRIRGFQSDGIYTFHGIKYADAARFQSPRPVKPWEGVRDALSYGYVAPLLAQETPSCEVLIPHRYWPMDEHCQYLNIWTGSLERTAKKPVMVWLHGGGFSSGSSIEHMAYDGENMSRYGDVVVVTLNHRLNILGYLDLSPFGDKYARSANVGNEDIIAALRWIQENIAGFGGDPENVTLFGQSGGGMKVWTLMQMPEADGLYRRGIIQSGVIDEVLDPKEEDGTQIVRAMLEELGLTAAEVERLEEIPYPQLADAYKRAAPKLAQEGIYIGCSPLPNRWYAGDPRKVGFREHAKRIPVMIGTVFGEFDFGHGIPRKAELGQEELMGMLKGKYGEAAGELLALFREAYPEKCAADLLSLDHVFRAPTIEFIRERGKSRGSETYAYLFAYEFPYDEGKPAWHCSEIPFVFHNADRIPVCSRPGSSGLLQDRIFGAWMSFARSGAPQVPEIEWKACAGEDEYVLVFDDTCSLRRNFDHALIARLREAAGPFVLEQVENLQH